MCARCEELSEEVAYYKSELGLIEDHTKAQRVRARFNISPLATKVAMRLYAAKGRFLTVQRLIEDTDLPSYECLRSAIYQARKGLGPQSIETDPWFGYSMSANGMSLVLGAIEPVETPQ